MEDKPEKKRKKVLRKLRYKFRLIMINDETYEEHFSLRLSLLNIITVLGLMMMIVAFFVGGALAFTPLREYIPGYSNLKTKQMATYAMQKADSLDLELQKRDNYLSNLKMILSGKISADSLSNNDVKDVHIDGIQDVRTHEDSIMRASIEEEERYALHNSADGIEEKIYFFFTPVKGTVMDSFDVQKRHFGTDVVTKTGEPIKAVMDGTIVMADFTTKSGYVVQIQHRNNLVSVYKHCSAVLKQTGEVVEAGDPIAVVGNTGELSSGPHLHFEIWENGVPIDPEKYILF